MPGTNPSPIRRPYGGSPGKGLNRRYPSGYDAGSIRIDSDVYRRTVKAPLEKVLLSITELQAHDRQILSRQHDIEKRTAELQEQVYDLFNWVSGYEDQLRNFQAQIAGLKLERLSFGMLESLRQEVAELKRVPADVLADFSKRLDDYTGVITRLNRWHKEAVQNAVDAVQSSRIDLLENPPHNHDSLFAAVALDVIIEIIPYSKLFRWGAGLLKSAGARMYALIRSKKEGVLKALFETVKNRADLRLNLKMSKLKDNLENFISRQASDKKNDIIEKEKAELIKQYVEKYGKRRSRGKEIHIQLPYKRRKQLDEKIEIIENQGPALELEISNEMDPVLKAREAGYQNLAKEIEVLQQKSKTYNDKIKALKANRKAGESFSADRMLFQKALDSNKNFSGSDEGGTETKDPLDAVLNSIGKNTGKRIRTQGIPTPLFGEHTNPPPISAIKETNVPGMDGGNGNAEEDHQSTEDHQPKKPEASGVPFSNPTKLPIDIALKIFFQHFWDSEVGVLEELSAMLRELRSDAESSPSLAWNALEAVAEIFEGIELGDSEAIEALRGDVATLSFRNELTAHYEFIIYSILLADEYELNAWTEGKVDPSAADARSGWTPPKPVPMENLEAMRKKGERIYITANKRGNSDSIMQIAVPHSTLLKEIPTFQYLYRRFGNNPFNPDLETLALRMKLCAEKYKRKIDA